MIQITIRWPAWCQSRLRRAALVLGVLGLVVGVPAALASHEYTDVPDGNPFHDDIAAVKRAGITAGKTCEPPGTPPTYCPGEPITREAMAAFVHRGFGRAAGGIAGHFPVTTTETAVATATIDVGGVPGQTQFALVTAALNGEALTPTEVFFYISQDGVGRLVENNGMTMAAEGPAGLAFASGNTTVVAAVPSGTTQTFRLVARALGGDGIAEMWGQISVITAPFGSTGTNTLAAGASTKGSTAGPPTKNRAITRAG
jgi:hypothetical protein